MKELTKKDEPGTGLHQYVINLMSNICDAPFDIVCEAEIEEVDMEIQQTPSQCQTTLTQRLEKTCIFISSGVQSAMAV